MPVAPEVAQFLQQLTETAAPGIEELSVDEARRQMEEGSVTLGPPEDVASVQDHSIPEGSPFDSRADLSAPGC